MMPFGNEPAGGRPPTPTVDQVPQAITAAMLMAAKSSCTCEVCQILRGAIDKMAAPFLPQKATPTT
jgi:hypothetical protein